MTDFSSVAGDMWNELENLRDEWEGTRRATFIEEVIAKYERLAGLTKPLNDDLLNLLASQMRSVVMVTPETVVTTLRAHPKTVLRALGGVKWDDGKRASIDGRSEAWFFPQEKS